MKYYGKEKCRILKEIRAEIARANDIEWVVSECRHQGNCKGTCPKCEAEVRQLEEALARREALGKKVAVVGISAAISLAVTGCDDLRTTTGDMPVDGDMIAPEQSEHETDTVVLDGEYMIPDTETVPVKGEEVAPEEENSTDSEKVPSTDETTVEGEA